MQRLIKDLVEWYKELYWIPGRILVWIGLVLVVGFVFCWVTMDQLKTHHTHKVYLHSVYE